MKKFLRKLFIILISILTSNIILLSCHNDENLEIIWRDFTKNGCNGTVEIALRSNENEVIDDNKTDHFKLIVNETKKINTKGFTNEIYFHGHSSGFAMEYYQSNFYPNKLELYLIDDIKITKRDDGTLIVPEKDGIEAYFLVSYDAEKDLRFQAVSKDNIFNYDKIFSFEETYKIVKNSKEIIDYVQQKDIAYYQSIQPDYFKDVIYCGYVIKSKIDGSYFWVDSYLN